MLGGTKMFPPESLCRFVDNQITALGRARFTPDPVLGSYSELASVLSSAPKRHGRIVEQAIVEALRQNPNYRVWAKVKFHIPAAADHAISSQSLAQSLATTMPYSSGERTLQIDLIAYNLERRHLGAYEIKRANGHHDAGKTRSLKRDVVAVQTVLHSYGQKHLNIVADRAISRAIFYYGKRSLPDPLALIGAQLDSHFDCPVRRYVETATCYFAARLDDFINRLDDLRPEIRQMALVFPG